MAAAFVSVQFDEVPEHLVRVRRADLRNSWHCIDHASEFTHVIEGRSDSGHDSGGGLTTLLVGWLVFHLLRPSRAPKGHAAVIYIYNPPS